jgi:predicted site-specific integrase-resolvase
MEPNQISETLLNIAAETNGIESDIISMLEGIEAKLFGPRNSEKALETASSLS